MHITWHLRPGSEEAFYKALRPLYEELIKWDELAYFNVFSFPGQPGVIRITEIWKCDVNWLMNVSHALTVVPLDINWLLAIE
jgi:hypothetical protein